jgi:enamine deaminase RidA (YjgF/YER057c/UK114 family)
MSSRLISSGSTFEAQIGDSRAVVAGLADPRMKIEIEVTALKPPAA